MKKFFLLFAVMGLFTLTANAQKKSCSMAKKASCSKSASATASVDANNPAAVLAAQDDSIESEFALIVEQLAMFKRTYVKNLEMLVLRM